MQSEKLLIRDNGSQVRIRVRFRTDGPNEICYYHDVLTQRGKNWDMVWAEEWGDNRQLKLSHEALQAAQLAEELKYVTKQEIHQAKLELWEKLKPVEGI